MSSDFQGGLQLAIAAAAVLVTSEKEKPLPPQAFGPELEPVMDLALPLLEVFNQHLPSPLCALGLYVQWVQASFLKQRRAHVSWLIPRLLSKVFPKYFTFFSMTQPGRGAKGQYPLRIQSHQQQEWQSQIQEKCGWALMKAPAPLQSPKLQLHQLNSYCFGSP